MLWKPERRIIIFFKVSSDKVQLYENVCYFKKNKRFFLTKIVFAWAKYSHFPTDYILMRWICND